MINFQFQKFMIIIKSYTCTIYIFNETRLDNLELTKCHLGKDLEKNKSQQWRPNILLHLNWKRDSGCSPLACLVSPRDLGLTLIKCMTRQSRIQTRVTKQTRNERGIKYICYQTPRMVLRAPTGSTCLRFTSSTSPIAST